MDPNHPKKKNKALGGRYYNFYDIHDAIYAIDKNLAEAIDLKDQLSSFYKNTTIETAKIEMDKLIKEFEESNVDTMRNFAKTLKEWKKGIIHSFIPLQGTKISRPTNAMIENRNKLIKDIKRGGNGFTCWPRFRNRVLFALSDQSVMQLYPLPKEKQSR